MEEYSQNKMNGEQKLIMCVAFLVAMVIMAIIVAFFVDELVDAPAEKACVQNTSENAQDRCDL